jgi:hypothetical protein
MQTYIAEIDDTEFYAAAGFDTTGVLVELITPEVEFTELFGREPDAGDVRLGIRRLIEIQRMLMSFHAVTH